VARLFHVSPATVWRWTTTGKIRCVRTDGGQCRFPEDAVREALDRLAAEDRSGVLD
jgi:excisionase family DNA binding protein